MKRLISIFMSAAIAFTSLTASLPAYAEEVAPQTEQVQNTPKASGTGTVGTLLSEEINEELTEQQGNQGFNVFAAEVEENVVTITFEALEDCTLVTAILDDAGEVLLYTESVDVLAGQTEAELTIAAEEMPQYFTLHAYLIDSDTFRPLCTVYECYTYTQEMQEFLAKTIEDFNEELVVNFDDSSTTNFGVFAEGTVILDYVEGVNTVASADEENNVYVFENADENITGLTAGTIMAYPYSDEIFLIVKVASVEVDGTTVTVTGEETSLEEAFDYLRIETVSDADDITVDNSNLEEGIVYNGVVEDVESTETSSDIDSDIICVEGDDKQALQGSGSLTKKFSYTTLDEKIGDTGVKINADIALSFSGTIKYYLTFSKQYLEFYLNGEAYIKMGISGKFEGSLSFGVFDISPVAGVYINFKPSVLFRSNASIDFVAKVKAKFGMRFENGQLINISEKPSLDEFGTKIEGAIFVGLSLAPKVAILADAISNVSLTAEAGIEFKGTMLDNKVSTRMNTLHPCDLCLDAEINGVIKVSVAGKLLNSDSLSFKGNLIDFSFKISDYYYSFEKSKGGFSTCPDIKYKVNVKVKDEHGYSYPNATITDHTNNTTVTNGYGGTDFYVSNGSHAITVKNVETGEYLTYNYRIKNAPFSIIINIDELDDGNSSEDNDDAPSSSEVIGCTDGFEYTLNSGEITITKYVGTATDVVIPKYIRGFPVTEIGDEAFYRNSNIKNCTIPTSITRIGAYAFYVCENLESVTIPYNVTEVGKWAFGHCDGLKRIAIQNSVIGEHMFTGCDSLPSIVIPYYVTKIGESAFASCDKLVDVSLESFVFGNYMFDGCISLKSIIIPYGATEIAPAMFYGCDKLSSVIIPSTVTKIRWSAFRGCDNLQNIDLPDSISEIEHGAFSSTGLSSLPLPPNITKIDYDVFSACNNLKYVNIPPRITEIGDRAFEYCDNLSIIIPSSITEIGYCVFNGCDNLNVAVPSSVTKISVVAFGNIAPSTLVIYGENGSYAETYATKYNITFKNISEFPSTVNEVATSSKSSTLPEEFTHTTTSDTASFTGLTAGETYNFYVLRDLDAEVPLSSDNLLYISQHVVGDNGTLSITYKPLADDYNAVAFVEQMSPFDISGAEVTIPEIIANGSTRYIQPVVMLNSEVLEIGADFEIGGDYPVIEAGTYTAVITGIGDYTGVINAEYALLSEDNKSVDVAAVLSYPTKTAYAYGESLDLTGGVIEVYYNNDTFEEVPMTADMISGFDSTKTGSQTLTITYGDLTAEYTITVAEKTVTKPILTAKAGDGKVDLTWTAIDGATQYNVYIYTTGYKLLTTTTETSYTATGLTNGTKYGFLVRAFVNGAWTAFTTADNVYATPVAVLKPVVTATAGEEQVTLKWNALEDATNYRVFSYMNGKYAVLGETTATTYTAPDLTAGTKYGFLVRAYVNGAWTVFSNDDVVYATPTAAAVTKPEVTATAGDGKVNISWNAVTGATNYNVYIYTTGYKLLTTTTETSYTATGLTNGTKYGFLVRAFVNGAWTTFTTADNVYATPEAVVVTKPELTATAGNGEVELEWNEVTGATSYNVFIYTTGYKLLATVTDTSYTATGLNNGTEYGFLVRAYVNGAWTAFTTADNVYATPKAASTKPEFTATAGIGRVTLDWEPVEGATNYNVFTYLNGKYAVAGTTTDTTYTVTNLEAGMEYGFLVRAYVNNVWSPFTTADNIYATPTAALKPVLTVTAGEGSAELSWTAVAGATNYRVFSYLNGKYTEITVTDETSCTADGLTSGTKYGFLVRAYVNGAWTAFSADDVTYATIL